MSDESSHTTTQSETDDRRWSLAELTDETGVSVRTVRFYISEGLLPPPNNPGPRASYSQVHYDRLVLIDRLKASYLPLKEIRRQLDELGDAEIHRLVSSPAPLAPMGVAMHHMEKPSSAGAYIAKLLHRTAEPVEMARAATQHVLNEDAIAEEPIYAPLAPEPATWRKVPLADGAELLIRDDLYHRKRDRVDWLVSWARKVFG